MTRSWPVDSATLDARRTRLAAEWKLEADEAVVVAAGTPIPRPGGQDQCLPYRVHPHFRWLTGLTEAGGMLAFDPSDGWTEFLPTPTPMDAVWEGRLPLGRGRDIGEYEGWLAARAGRTVHRLGCGHDAPEDARADALERAFLHARRPKDADELVLLRRAVAATAVGFAEARALLAEGVTERAVQIALESASFRAGGETMGYDTIVGFGPTSAIFHAAPGGRALAAGDQVLVDAGAEVEGYTADVTRTWPGPGGFTALQKDCFDLLSAVETAACMACRPGVEWHDIHRLAARGIAEGLRGFGLLRCGADEALETEAIALFFPHGVGHLVGLGVRDASGTGPGRPVKRRCCGTTPRCDLILEPGYVATVEPGIYCIPTLLRDPDLRARYAGQVAWDRVDAWMTPGGFRIEDDILVTHGEPENLTAGIPH
ncbi:MAG: aminopeptidase P N-terminal domain-containing protein [Armatimonadota bacterium]